MLPYLTISRYWQVYFSLVSCPFVPEFVLSFLLITSKELRSNAMGVAFTFCVFGFNILPRLPTHTIAAIHCSTIESEQYKLLNTKSRYK